MDGFIICLGVDGLFNVLDSAKASFKWVALFFFLPLIFKYSSIFLEVSPDMVFLETLRKKKYFK